ncbi:hypothetical protein BBJ28_00019513, partial [Nothophytophthora sp. Chile5]
TATLAVLPALLPLKCNAWEVTLWSGYGIKPKHKVFTADTTQRCFTFRDGCGNDYGAKADWKSVPKGAKIVFYADAECKGTSAESKKVSNGQMTFSKHGFGGKVVSSNVVQESGASATKGFGHVCDERGILGSANATDASVDGSPVPIFSIEQPLDLDCRLTQKHCYSEAHRVGRAKV